MATQVEPGPSSPAHPAGNVTFLFSDIEGSTTRWDADPRAMASALERHDAVVRAALEAHGAYVFKTMGDAFCAAFSAPADALAAALRAQRALSSEDFSGVQGLRVRMALHTGSAHERAGDYVGPAVNRIARLLAIAHGGQVVLSAAAAELLQGSLPHETSLLDLGDHRLKDLAVPERVFQLVAPGLAETFPPLRSQEHLTNNLPAQLTSFVGRDAVVSEIKALIDRHRLVTLTGSGGAGKTRCAIEVGADLLEGSGDGVWFVELAPLTDPVFVANAIAQALQVREDLTRPLLDTVILHLRRKRLLLILDNCEHVLDEARRVAVAIVHDCPGVRVLATGREPLNVAGEAAFRMPSLDPYGGAQLFTDRALLSDSRFALTQENVPYVTEICRRLDGIPLAIELAAARVKLLPPKELARRLDERFRVLTGGDRSALPRHRTMRALIDWSYDLLSDGERELLRKVSLFAGGFTLESAHALCSGRDELEVLELLSSLVDKSLVQAEQSENGTRYGLLESTRQYAREKLVECGEEKAASQAHARAMETLAQRVEDDWDAMPDRAWLAALQPEMENYRAALSWAFGADGDQVLGLRLTANLRKAWLTLAAAEGMRRLISARERITDETPEETVAALDLAEASLCTRMHKFKTSLALGNRALAYYAKRENSSSRALAKEVVGDSLLTLGKIDEGEVLLKEALADRRALGARKSEAGVLLFLAQAREFTGDAQAARVLFHEALQAARASGGERLAAIIAMNLAEMEFRRGDVESAVRLSGDAGELLRGLGDTQILAFLLSNNAAYFLEAGRYEEARVAAREAMSVAGDSGDAAAQALAIRRLAAIAALRPARDSAATQERDRAARLAGYARAAFADIEESQDDTERHQYESVIRVLKESLGEGRLSMLMAQGSEFSQDRAIEEALLV